MTQPKLTPAQRALFDESARRRYAIIHSNRSNRWFASHSPEFTIRAKTAEAVVKYMTKLPHDTDLDADVYVHWRDVETWKS